MFRAFLIYNTNSKIAQNEALCYSSLTLMENTIQYIQIISGILTLILVLIQRSSGDAGGILSGDSAQFFQTRRGGEKFLFTLTIITSIIFVASSVLAII
jgi:protein translocase SecG subunit